MLDAFRAGGWVMWPLLVVGAMAVVVATRHASMPAPGWARAARTARGVVLAGAVAALGVDLAAVLSAVGAAQREVQATILAVGVLESLAPLVLGLVFVGLAGLFSLVGDLRDAGMRAGAVRRRAVVALPDGEVAWAEEVQSALDRLATRR